MWSEALRILQVSAVGSTRQVKLMFWLTGLNAVAFVATAIAMVWTELPATSEFDQIKDMVLYLAFLGTFVFHAWKLCTGEPESEPARLHTMHVPRQCPAAASCSPTRPPAP